MNNERTPFWVYLCAISFSLIVGLVSFTNKNVTPYAVPFIVVGIRYTISVLCNLAGQKLGLITCNVKGKEHLLLLYLSGLVYAASYLTQILGLFYVDSLYSGIMLATVPIWSNVLAFFILKERITLKQLFFLILSAAALIVMIVLGSARSSDAVNLFGIILLVFTAIFEALNGIIVRYLKTWYNPLEISYISAFSGGLFSILIAVILVLVGFTPVSLVITAFTAPKFWIAVLFLGFFCTFVASILKGQILHHMSTVKAMIWYNLTTPISVLAGVFLLHEPFHLYHLICTALIIVGVVGIQLSKPAQ